MVISVLYTVDPETGRYTMFSPTGDFEAIGPAKKDLRGSHAAKPLISLCDRVHRL